MESRKVDAYVFLIDAERYLSPFKGELRLYSDVEESPVIYAEFTFDESCKKLLPYQLIGKKLVVDSDHLNYYLNNPDLYGYIDCEEIIHSAEDMYYYIPTIDQKSEKVEIGFNIPVFHFTEEEILNIFSPYWRYDNRNRRVSAIEMMKEPVIKDIDDEEEENENGTD